MPERTFVVSEVKKKRVVHKLGKCIVRVRMRVGHGVCVRKRKHAVEINVRMRTGIVVPNVRV